MTIEREGAPMSKEVVEAITDLTRVTLALSGKYASKSEAIRALHGLAIPSGRIAAILAMKQPDVASAISKFKKKAGAANGE
jgi:hypothetical protein